MAFTLTCFVKIGKFSFDYVHSVKITSSWKSLGDTAVIKLPPLGRKLELGVKCGDSVTVQIGYVGFPLRTEFTGFVSEVSPKLPFEITCEDGIYPLRRKPVNKSWEQIQLKDLLRELVPDAQLSKSIPAVTLSPFRLPTTTVANALRKLKEDYMLCAYFRDGKLFVGLPYSEFTKADKSEGRFVIYDRSRNVRKNGYNLNYMRSEDVLLKARVINLLPDNKRVEVEVGPAEGEVRTIHFRNATTDKEALKKLGERELAKYRYDGYRGSFKAWGLPYVVHSATVQLLDPIYPERKDSYLVDQVVSVFDTTGFNRAVEIGPRV